MIQASPVSAGKQRELTDGDDAPIVVGGAADDIADFVGETKACALDDALAGGGHACLPAAACGALLGLPWSCSPSCSVIC